MLAVSGGEEGGGGRTSRALTAAQLLLARDWSGEHKLKQFLLRHYDATTRPVRSDKTPVKVQISIALYHILDTVRSSSVLMNKSLSASNIVKKLICIHQIRTLIPMSNIFCSHLILIIKYTRNQLVLILVNVSILNDCVCFCFVFTCIIDS